MDDKSLDEESSKYFSAATEEEEVALDEDFEKFA